MLQLPIAFALALAQPAQLTQTDIMQGNLTGAHLRIVLIDWTDGDATDDDAEEPAPTDDPAAADEGLQQPTGRGHMTSEGARADVHMSEAGPSSAAGHTTPAGARADVSMSEAGPSSEAGHTTPEGERADAATPTRTADTLHMHSVASTAKRQRGPQLSRSARRRAAKHARAEYDG